VPPLSSRFFTLRHHQHTTQVLAGMAGKVQDAIQHNKRIFEQRMQAEVRLYLFTPGQIRSSSPLCLKLLHQIHLCMHATKSTNRPNPTNRVHTIYPHQERSLCRKAFQTWLARRAASLAKRRVLARAVCRLARGTLVRAFFSWKDELHLVDRTLAMTRKVGVGVGWGGWGG
jgi:hypothetical protein